MFSMETSVILHGSKERSVILHGSKEARSRRDYIRKLVAIEKKNLAAILLYTSTEQTAKLENLQNASHNKYTKLHLTTNTCNFEQKIQLWHSNFLTCS